MMFDQSILQLMAITDAGDFNGSFDKDALIERAVAAVAHGKGATCLQVRLKGVPARTIAEITRAIVAQVNVPVLVNDRFDIALAAGAAGVHLGADDVPVAYARRCVPPGFIIGTSVGNDAEIANAELADYVGIGPIFATGSKSDAGSSIGVPELKRLSAKTGKPAIAIGGITAERIPHVMTDDVVAHGVVGVAAIGAIFGPRNAMYDPPHVAEAAYILRQAMYRRA